MGEDSKAFINEMQIDVSQKRVTKLIEAKKTIKEVIHYDPSEKSKYKTIVNMIDEENHINKTTNKVEIIINPKLREHMKLALDNNSLEHDNRLTIDEAVNNLAKTFVQMKNIMDGVAIEDCWYSKEFFEEVENALITMAVIKAFGISKKSERYLGAIRKVVIELRTAESKG